jgi:hypothetical protein
MQCRAHSRARSIRSPRCRPGTRISGDAPETPPGLQTVALRDIGLLRHRGLRHDCSSPNHAAIESPAKVRAATTTSATHQPREAMTGPQERPLGYALESHHPRGLAGACPSDGCGTDHRRGVPPLPESPRCCDTGCSLCRASARTTADIRFRTDPLIEPPRRASASATRAPRLPAPDPRPIAQDSRNPARACALGNHHPGARRLSGTPCLQCLHYL